MRFTSVAPTYDRLPITTYIQHMSHAIFFSQGTFREGVGAEWSIFHFAGMPNILICLNGEAFNGRRFGATGIITCLPLTEKARYCFLMPTSFAK